MKASAGRRVLLVTENSSYPLDLRVRNEATALANAGYQVSVICQRADHQPWRENLEGVALFRYPPPPQAHGFLSYALEYAYSFAAMSLLSLYVWIRHGFDIIHTANPPDTAVFMAMFYKLFGKQFVFDHHDLAPEMYLVRYRHKGRRLVHRILMWMESMSFRVADHVIPTNESYKRVAMDRGHVPEDRITIVRNGPALERLKLVEPDPDLKRKGVTIIGYVGVMGPQDGLDYLLRAAAAVDHRLGERRFLLRHHREG